MSYGVRWVQVAAIRPHRCALNPMIGNHNSQKGFLDFGTDLGALGNHPGDHVYVSVLMAEQAAEVLGWSSPADAAALKQQTERDRMRIDELETQLTDTRAQLGAVQVLKSAGYTTARKPGRPPKAKARASDAVR